jgi:two-component system, NarL family, sensor histidine kinase DevS
VERSAALSAPEIDLRVDLAADPVDQRDRLAPAIETTVYRVVQEALTNVAKHSGAAHATVSVVERDGRIEVTVADDGRGFSGEDGTAGFGLIGMRERIRLAGGRHEIDTAPGRGTTVRAWLPAGRDDHAVGEHAHAG